MVLTESSVHSILYLMFLFLYLTELTILLKMEFLALIFLIVYIGAVCVLLLFHIKLIKTFVHRFDNVHSKELFLPLITVTIFIPIIQIFTLAFETKENEFEKSILMSKSWTFDSVDQIYNYTSWIDIYETFTDTQLLGFLLYNVYFLYLILGSFILLVAMIGSIFLTLTKKKEKKFQSIEKQVFVEISKSLFTK
jgi:NADH:ubiquinone oxidoreductase subunit 6 (subunit J)